MSSNYKKNSPGEDRFEIRLSGSGGQGLISAGMLLAEAISIGDKRNAVQTQSYGPEARGGATRCDVVVSSHEIYYPECTSFDILVALTQEASDKYSLGVKAGGLLIVDKNAVDVVGGDIKPHRIPFIHSAKEKLGNELPANIVALGFIAEYTGIVTKKSLENSIRERFEGSRYLNMNVKAVKIGYELAKEEKSKSSRKKKR